MQCQNCQHWNEAGSRFCEECGVELSTAEKQVHQVSMRPLSSSGNNATDPTPLPQVLTPINAPPPTPYNGPRLVLDSTGSIFKLADATLIGREDASLQIDLDGYPDGKYISHRHAQILKTNGKFYIEDLGSANRTWVNDIKLAEGQSEPLNAGDKVRLGKITLTFLDA